MPALESGIFPLTLSIPGMLAEPLESGETLELVLLLLQATIKVKAKAEKIIFFIVTF